MATNPLKETVLSEDGETAEVKMKVVDREEMTSFPTNEN